MQHICSFYGLIQNKQPTTPYCMIDNPRKKILFIITKSNFGGAQRYVYDLATNLQNSYDITVAHGGNGLLAEKLRAAGVNTIALKALQRDISLSKEARAVLELYKIIKQTRPDVLHINSSKAGLYGSVLGRILGVPRVVFTAHGWVFNEPRSTLSKHCFRTLHWLTVWLSHHTITVSRTLKEQLRIPFAEKKITPIPLAIDPPTYFNRQVAKASIDHELAQQETSLWLGTIAELHPVKNHQSILRSLPAVLKSFPNCYYVIVGDGEEMSALKKLAQQLNIKDQVIFTGHIDSAAAYIKAFDIFLLPSTTEAAGYVLHEAAHACIPIIASKVGGIPELIKNKTTGLLVPPTDTFTWANTIKESLRDPYPLLDYASVLSQQVQQYSLTDMTSATKAIYESNKVSDVNTLS